MPNPNPRAREEEEQRNRQKGNPQSNKWNEGMSKTGSSDPKKPAQPWKSK